MFEKIKNYFSPGTVAKAMSISQYIDSLFMGMRGGITRVDDPYSKVDVVFACISAKWSAIDSIPWALYDRDNNVIEDGMAAELLRKPHPQITRTQLLAWLVVSLDLRGKAFFWIEADDAGTPVALWPLVPHRMNPIFTVHPETGTKLVSAWQYGSPSGKMVSFFPQELLHFRYPHPTEWWDGLARIAPADLPISQYHAATEFQAKSFSNEGVVAALMSAKTPLKEEQLTAARESWQAVYGGSRNAKKTAFIGSNWDYKRIALTPQELDYLNSNKWSAERICMSLGTPPAMIGLRGDPGLGSGKEDENSTKTFWINTVIPLFAMIEGGFNAQVLNNPLWRWKKGARPERACKRLGFTAQALARAKASVNITQQVVMFDRDAVSVLSAERNRIIEGASKLWAMGMPLADISEYYDLGIPDRPWHHTGFLPFSVTPVENVGAEPAAPAAEPAKSMEDVFTRLDASIKSLATTAKGSDARAHNWKRHNSNIERNAKQLRGRFRSYFARQRIEMLRRLEARRSVKALATKGLFLDLIFDLSSENARLRADLRPILLGQIEQSGQEQFDELSAGSYEVSPRAEALIKQLLKNAEQVNQTTSDRLQAALQEGVDSGEIDNIDKLAERIREVYRDRESTGARTAGEYGAVGAYNGARTDAQEQAGIEQQEWLSARDDHVRPSHNEADGQIVGIGEPFDVGGEALQYPGDPSASLEETINCRCVAVPVLSKD